MIETHFRSTKNIVDVKFEKISLSANALAGLFQRYISPFLLELNVKSKERLLLFTHLVEDWNVHAKCKEHYNHAKNDEGVYNFYGHMWEEEECEEYNKECCGTDFSKPLCAIQHFTTFDEVQSHNSHVAFFDDHQCNQCPHEWISEC